ncbi:MAG: outer membrane beta-barrel protein, partial [Chitinophagaceae bacterium]
DASIGNGHGLFTYYLVDGLSGVADNIGPPDNKVSYEEIKSYVDKNVPSVAQQRFRKKQDPYFCCTENSNKIISIVDTAYLSNWLKIKRQQNRGGGNSFNGAIRRSTRNFFEADTVLIETYNRFYQAVKDKKISGTASAEDYFSQLNKKFPGNPYTLDAKSTLAVEYINEAQARVDEYLSCNEPSAKQKSANYEAGLRLEKAINILREDDPDFANSLRGRMHLLKTSNSDADRNAAFQNAYAALSIDRNGAYIQNKLALLHLENNRADSALYYAEKASTTAPKWQCALNTLALVRKTTAKQPNKNKPVRKNSFGGVAGGGISQLTPTFAGTRNTNIIAVNPKDIVKADLGIFYQVGIGNSIAIRPTTLVSMEGGELVYDRRFVTGGQIFHDTVKLKNTSVSVALPVIIYLSGKKVAPYISLGPSFNYILSQDATSSELVPVKKSVFLGDAALGVDIPLGKSRLLLSSELKYTQGFNDQKETGTADVSDVLSSLKKRGVTFSIYLRGR